MNDIERERERTIIEERKHWTQIFPFYYMLKTVQELKLTQSSLIILN